MKAARQQAIVDLLLNHTSLTTEALIVQGKPASGIWMR
ncbi:hypothetical protein SFK315_3723 [Shigella flexneri K-315]|uniref:Uncharacterized protein n=1 Tax=Shigella flexneri K-315 TaxID=766150 RepID=I6CHB1_SHIFL|nr:hypothetical protein SFK315_3723 [Shigella flexneri K-315]